MISFYRMYDAAAMLQSLHHSSKFFFANSQCDISTQLLGRYKADIPYNQTDKLEKLKWFLSVILETKIFFQNLKETEQSNLRY